MPWAQRFGDSVRVPTQRHMERRFVIREMRVAVEVRIEGDGMLDLFVSECVD